MLSSLLAAVESEEDKSLLAQLYTEHEQKMYRVAVSILKNSTDAEDAVHEAFLRLINNFEKIRDISCNERGFYLVIIVRNISIDMLNKKSRHPEYDIDEFYDIEADGSVEDEALSNIGRDRIMSAIRQLPDDYYEILYLYLFKEYTPAEISGLIGISPELARQRIFRGKKKLQKLLEEE